jgi:hypothetical protein
MSRINLLANMLNKPNGVFVEIGTYKGGFAEEILTFNPTCTLYCIDPYLSYEDYNDASGDDNGDALFESTKARLSKFGNRVKILREFADNAVNLIPNEIDFLYIDGNHKYKYVLNELRNYFPKVRSGGYIVGDDAFDTDESKRNIHGDIFFDWKEQGWGYGDFGVIKAFRDFLKEKNITNGYIENLQYIFRKP